VIVNDWLSPQLTRVAPLGVMLPWSPAEAVIVSTSIAKLATHPEFFRCKRIGFLCLDTYRVGAVEQIRTYAEIAGLPLEVIYEAADLPMALRRLADRDLILVDSVAQLIVDFLPAAAPALVSKPLP